MPMRTQPSRVSGSAIAAWVAAMCRSGGARPADAATPTPSSNGAQRDPVVLGGGVGEVAEQADHAEPADALEARRLGEHDPVVLGCDAVAGQPGLELEVHADGRSEDAAAAACSS